MQVGLGRRAKSVPSLAGQLVLCLVLQWGEVGPKALCQLAWRGMDWLPGGSLLGQWGTGDACQPASSTTLAGRGAHLAGWRHYALAGGNPQLASCALACSAIIRSRSIRAMAASNSRSSIAR